MTLKEKVLAHWRRNKRIVRKSRGKWRKLPCGARSYEFSAGIVGISGLDCVFCHEYYAFSDPFGDEDTEVNSCRGCPIEKKTGQPHCRDTPWDEVRKALDGTNKAAILRAMDKEIAFLEGV